MTALAEAVLALFALPLVVIACAGVGDLLDRRRTR